MKPSRRKQSKWLLKSRNEYRVSVIGNVKGEANSRCAHVSGFVLDVFFFGVS